MKDQNQSEEHSQDNERTAPPFPTPLEFCLTIFAHEGGTLFPRGERANESARGVRRCAWTRLASRFPRCKHESGQAFRLSRRQALDKGTRGAGAAAYFGPAIATRAHGGAANSREHARRFARGFAAGRSGRFGTRPENGASCRRGVYHSHGRKRGDWSMADRTTRNEKSESRITGSANAPATGEISRTCSGGCAHARAAGRERHHDSGSAWAIGCGCERNRRDH